MGEENPVKFQEQPEGQPVTDSAKDQVAQEIEQARNDGLSEERIAKIIDERLDRFSRQQQSLRDKQESRIRDDVQKQINRLQKAGVDVTDDMKKNIEAVTREDIANEYRDSNDSTGTEGQPNPRSDQRETNPKELLVNSALEKLDQQFGFLINKNDPEAETIKSDDPFEFVRLYEKALQAKKERLGSSHDTNPMSQLHTSGGSATPGNKLAGITDKDQLWQEFRKK